MTEPDIDEFRLVRVLGQGAMGTVYLGHDTILDRAVALKLVRVGVTEESRLRFLTEARAIARLDHPNVIAIFRAGTTRGGEPYLVQELVRGRSLDRVELPLAERRCLEVAIGIARGLAAAHRRGVLHRDIKPSNIMIDDAGTPRLLDFGIAKLTGPGAEPPRAVPRAPAAGEDLEATEGPEPTSAPARGGGAGELGATRGGSSTTAGEILGTPRYRAPELWRGDAATARSDLYSLGAVIYELLAGAAPYPHADRDALERAVLDGAPPPPPGGIDADLAALVMRCLARDPAARPESADEVVFRLERIAAGAPPIPDGNPYRGLAPFEAEQRALFFGRGPEISAIVDRLRSEALVVVAGDSGIGKSSLCRAGVLPAIAAGALGDGHAWATRAVTLGRRPLRALADGLGLDELPADAGLLARRLADRRLLLFVDQLEELVTQSAPADAARAAAVLAALGDGPPGIKLVVAVRGDFLTRVAALPGLRGALTRSLHLVRGLAPDDARDAVAAPALAKGVRFESDAMVAALAGSLVDGPAALPLLQFTLSELWSRRDAERGVIPARALDEVGGVAGALARYADHVITALGEAERAAARRILLSLVADGARASRVRAELVADAAAATALEALVRGRLVVARDVADGEPIHELAHESLLTAWGTLRGWLDDVAGQRGIRTRLHAAAAEWRRRGRRREDLWRSSQLAAARRLDDLAAGDRAFLDASRGAARLRAALTIAILAAVPAAAGAAWWGAARGEQGKRERVVAAHLARARDAMRAASSTVTEAQRVRADAIAMFRAATAPQPIPEAPAAARAAAQKERRGKLAARERRWDESEALFAAARTGMREATRALEAALQIDAHRGEARRAMAAVIYEQAVLADFLHEDVSDLEQRLVTYDDGSLVARWRRPAEIAIAAAGARDIAVARYFDGPEGSKSLSAPVLVAAGAHLRGALAPGSYLARISADRIDPVQLPFVVRRGEPVALDVALPRPGEVPPDFVYIPAGAFLFGSDDRQQPDLAWLRRNFLRAPPLHAATTGPYLIARHEVTFGDWLAYLRSLPADELERRRPQGSLKEQKSVRLDRGADQRFILSLRPLDHVYTAAEGEPLRYPLRARRTAIRWERSPVGGVNRDDAEAYAAWLAATGRVPGARLCTPLEWERAARGADGRRFPHGDRMAPDDFNIDETYDREALGPDEVGAHPVSASPFGLMDMSGNAFELVAHGPEISIRGGSWWGGPTSAATMNATPTQPTRRDAYIGIRLCADPPPRITALARSTR